MSSKELSHVMSRRTTITPTELLHAILHYATRRELIGEDRTLQPDALLSELFGTSEPIHVKDMLFHIRTYTKVKN
jgi:hypothetical protein